MMHRLFPRLILLALVSLAQWACQASAATYGYAHNSLSWIDPVANGHIALTTTSTPISWSTTASGGGVYYAPNCANGTTYSAGGYQVDDDITQPINLGFTFTYGATAYTQVRIMSNGRLQFNNNYCYFGTNNPVTSPPTYTMPYPDANLINTMRVYGADFCPAGAPNQAPPCVGTVYYTSTAQGTAPNRYFVATWYQMKEWNSGTSLFNVQMILYENGDFVYQYKDIANATQGVGQVGYELSTSDYVIVDLDTINSLAYTSLRFYKPTQPLVDYHFDECTGTTAADSSGNGYTGTLSGTVTPANTGQICTGYTFGGGYVSLPTTTPLVTGMTMTGWFNPTNVGTAGQRIFADSITATGYSVSLADGGSGKLRFSAPALSATVIDSSAVVTTNKWHFVVAVADPVGQTINLSVYDSAGNLLSQGATAWTNAWTSGNGTASIGGVSGGNRFSGNIDELKVYSRVLAATEIASIYNNERIGLQRDGTQRSCTICNVTLGTFNAFETSTAAGSTTGVIRTKISGQSFATGNGSNSGNIDVVGLSGGALANIASNSTVTFLDAHDNTGALNASTGCRSSWSAITSGLDSGLAAAITVGAGNSNRVSLPTVTPVNAWPAVRVQVCKQGSTTACGCSNDAFAIRPAYFDTTSVQVQDLTWSTNGAGTQRALTNQSASGGVVHAAGMPVSISGLVARNAAGTAIKNYTGTPTLIPGNLVLPDASYCSANGYTCLPGTFNGGTWTYSATTGIISSTTASYSDVGVFSWEVNDETFSNVDAGDSTINQRYFRDNAVIYTGRFVPASYQATMNSPVLQTFGSTCAARSFTYLGQPFGYSSPPSVNIVALNGASIPAQTYLYLGTSATLGLWKLASPLSYSSSTCTAPTASCAIVRQDASSKISLTATYTSSPTTPGWATLNTAALGAATLTSNNNGSGTLTFGATDSLALYRNPAAPLASFAETISLDLGFSDLTEAGVTGNPASITGTVASTPLSFDSGNTFVYGRLRLLSGQGSDLAPYNLQTEAQYWNGSYWLTNVADNCTTYAAANITLTGSTGTSVSSVTPVNKGFGSVLLAKPTSAGTASVCMNLASTGSGCTTGTAGSMSYLLGNWGALGTFIYDPSATLLFGNARSDSRGNWGFLYRRENF